MPAHAFLGDFLEADAFDGRGRAGEIFLDEIGGKSHRVEDLRAAIGLIGRDAHFGHHLQNAFADRLDVVLLHVIGLHRQPHLHADLLQRLESEIGIDRFRAVTRQRAEMMHLARFAGLDHEPGLHAQALADQMMMDGGDREQRRNGNALGRNRAVGQDQDVVVGEHRVGGFAADAVDGFFQPLGAFGRGPGAVERRGAEGAVQQFRNRADLFEIRIGQHGLGDFQPLVRARVAPEQIRPRPDDRDERGHQLLADGIERRVGHLREVLVEIIVEQLRPLREHGDRLVGAHRADGIVPILRHRFEEELDVFLRVAEGLLAIEQRRGLVRRRDQRRFGQIGQLMQLELRVLQPFLVGLGFRRACA